MKRPGAVCAVLAAVLIVAASAMRAETVDYKVYLDKTKKELSELRSRIKQERSDLSKAKTKEKATSKHLQQIEREISLTKKELDVFDNNISVISAGIKDIETRMAEAKRLMKEKEKLIGKIIREEYKKEESAQIKLLLKSKSASEFINRYKFMKVISKKNAQLIAQYSAAISSLETDAAVLKEYRSEIESLRSQKAREWERYKNEKWEKRTLLKTIQNNITQRKKMVGELEKSAGKLGAMLQKIQATAELSDKDAGEAFAKSRKKFPWPVLSGGKILAGFGKYKHPKFKTIVYNRGMHIAAKNGEPVYSIFKGTVMYADWFEGYGKMVIVYHGGNYYSIYAHLSDINTAVNSKVQMRDVVGKAGDTESFYGDALYFEIRHKTEPVNPMNYLANR